MKMKNRLHKKPVNKFIFARLGSEIVWRRTRCKKHNLFFKKKSTNIAIKCNIFVLTERNL